MKNVIEQWSHFSVLIFLLVSLIYNIILNHTIYNFKY